MPFDLDAPDPKRFRTPRTDARTRLASLLAELPDRDVQELLGVAQRLELAQHLEHERRRP